jgi:hypothetical protein
MSVSASVISAAIDVISDDALVVIKDVTAFIHIFHSFFVVHFNELDFLHIQLRCHHNPQQISHCL